MLRTRLWIGMCETLMPDVMAPENDCSYVRELSGLAYFRFTMQEFSMVCGCTKHLQNCQMWVLALDNTVYINRLLNSKVLLSFISFLSRIPTKVLMMNTWVLNQPKRAMVLAICSNTYLLLVYVVSMWIYFPEYRT